MTDWNALFKIGLALFAIVNPIGILPFFIMATNGWSPEERFRTARTVSYTVFTVLVLSALIGDKLLEFFGITIPSFQIGGGILLLMMAIGMMHPKPRSATDIQNAGDHDVVAIVPLSIPLLAGPGAISSMIIAAQQNKGLLWHFQLIAPIFVIVLLIWLILRLSDGIAQKLGTIGISVITRLMGLILAAMAVEFIAKGLTGLFPKLLTG